NRRTYSETDVHNVFSRADSIPPLGFQSATINDTRHQDQTGFSLKLGLLAKPNEHLSFGLTIESPQVFWIHDEFQRTGTSQFNFNNNFDSQDQNGNPDIDQL